MTKSTQELTKLSTLVEVAVGGMAAHSYLTHRNMGNITIMSGT
ncbi:hypothetical protein [Shewanella sp. NKUCC05_KAH]|nr:hypothetical protein [Shewanella sp. NKUCC05_KAH]